MISDGGLEIPVNWLLVIRLCAPLQPHGCVWCCWCLLCGHAFDFYDYYPESLSFAGFKDMATRRCFLIYDAFLMADFILLWNPSHLYYLHWTNWTRKSRCRLLPRCGELLVLGLFYVDGWFIYQIADLCLFRINLWRLDHMCGLKCL